MTVKFFVRDAWADGHLLERMNAAGLPSTLQTFSAQNGRIQRIEYECPSELALALLIAGCKMEFTVWSPEILEYRRVN